MSHYKPYPAYKDSGVEWLGRVPAHWVACRFSRVIAGIKDGTHGTFERVDNGQPLLSAKNVADGLLDISSTESQISDFDHLSIVGNGYPKKGDLLLTIVGTIGRSCVYMFDEPLSFQRSVCFIRLSSKYSPEFFRYFTQSKFFQEQIHSKSKSSAQAGIYMGDVSATSIAFPVSRKEQQTVVALLDHETTRIDALIEKKTRFIDLLREKRQALITNAVTKGLDPKVKMKESGVEWLGAVPEHWGISPLKHLARFRSGGTPAKDNLEYWDGDIPWASAKDLKQEMLADTIDHLTDSAIEVGAASLVPSGSILVVVRGMILARLFPVVETLVPMAINQDLKAVVPSERLNSRYLAHLLRGSSAESLSRLEEAGHGTKALRMENWVSIELPVPPLHEQLAIIESLDIQTVRIDTLAEKNRHSIALLKERRSALITAAVTGQIDLREAV